MSTLQVRTLPVSRIKPARYNPRIRLTPTSPAYRKLRASLEKFGLVEPLVFNARSGRLVGGHARFRILKELGFKEIPVSVVRLGRAEEKALNIVLNNQEAQGRYDPKKLAAVLRELKDLGAMEDAGFGEATIRQLEFTPVTARDPAPVPDCVEIRLVVSEADYDRLAPKLDRLVREYDLVSHVIRAAAEVRDRPGRRVIPKANRTR